MSVWVNYNKVPAIIKIIIDNILHQTSSYINGRGVDKDVVKKLDGNRLLVWTNYNKVHAVIR